MEWHEKAADDFIELVDYYGVEETKHWQENDIRFHFQAGMIVRNMLRELGYTDDKYGNLDDHYLKILNICYKKVGIE